MAHLIIAKNKRNMILILTFIIFVLFGVLLLVRNHISKLENSILDNDSNIAVLYMENIEAIDSKNLDTYILYALDYAYNEQGKEILTTKEIKSIIESLFNKKISSKKLNNIGITPVLLEHNVIHNRDEASYEIDRSSFSQREIASIPIIVYRKKNIKKRGNNYIIAYKKVTFKNPYDILNYYGDATNENNKKDKKKQHNNKKLLEYDTSKILDYLMAKGKVKDIKLAVNDDIVKKYGKVSKKDVKIIYKLVGTKFKIDSIK